MSSGKSAMRVVFSELFVRKVAALRPKMREQVRAAVETIIKNPTKNTEPHHYPWPGCFEKPAGYHWIVFGLCGACRKQGSHHAECSNYDDQTIVFRNLYIRF